MTAKTNLIALAAVLVLAAGCSRGGDTTTTSVPAGAQESTTSVAAGGGTGEQSPSETPDTTTTQADTTTTEALVELEYELRVQGTASDNSAILVFQIPGGTANDQALLNLFHELVDQYAPVHQLDIVDSSDAVDLVHRNPDTLTEEQQDVMDAHHLLQYAGGSVTWMGPFENLEGFVYGS